MLVLNVIRIRKTLTDNRACTKNVKHPRCTHTISYQYFDQLSKFQSFRQRLAGGSVKMKLKFLRGGRFFHIELGHNFPFAS